jgi:hypothetical protein
VLVLASELPESGEGSNEKRSSEDDLCSSSGVLSQSE